MISCLQCPVDNQSLTEIHINKALWLLSRQFEKIGGLAVPDLGCKLNASRVYILNCDNNHWVTLTNINKIHEGKWVVYDSLNDSNNIRRIKM